MSASSPRRAERIQALLLAALQPDAIEVSDESAAHAGHGGFDAEGSHFRVRIVSARFVGLSRLARHRLVYDALASMMHRDIHALVLDCQASADPPSANPH
ncbi:MAG: BolA family transcriptional regulator [Thiomonas sp. 20-64-5]|nr:MAG: BolA family transcriptional regulator [Thiomonas sp. 20-64-5]